MKLTLKTIAAVLLLVCWSVAEGQELKIVSFNIRYNSWNNIDGENGWPYRKDAVARMIATERPAAIGLQEALINQLEYLDEKLNNYRRIGVGRDDGKTSGEFMAIYYDTGQVELVTATTKWLRKRPDTPGKGWDAACARTVTIATFRVKESGKEFVYYNTHLDHVGKTARAESTKLISSFIRESGQNMAIIVGGDMNSTISDTIFESFYMEGLEVARNITSQNRSDNSNTYNAYGKGDGAVIDHFFVKGVKVAWLRTLDGDYGVPYISDHYPIEMTINL